MAYSRMMRLISAGSIGKQENIDREVEADMLFKSQDR